MEYAVLWHRQNVSANGRGGGVNDLTPELRYLICQHIVEPSWCAYASGVSEKKIDRLVLILSACTVRTVWRRAASERSFEKILMSPCDSEVSRLQ